MFCQLRLSAASKSILGQHSHQGMLTVGLNYCTRMGTCMRPFQI